MEAATTSARSPLGVARLRPEEGDDAKGTAREQRARNVVGALLKTRQRIHQHLSHLDSVDNFTYALLISYFVMFLDHPQFL